MHKNMFTDMLKDDDTTILNSNGFKFYNYKKSPRNYLSKHHQSSSSSIIRNCPLTVVVGAPLAIPFGPSAKAYSPVSYIFIYTYIYIYTYIFIYLYIYIHKD
jgi:hypothetical protein